ncbi:Cys-tRNA(Pro) deacylase [Leptolyngbya sp. FACHB-671]|uniref:Cys-tRNA(Pro) deacylase n=1 Tax=Leptolyngbya sp. FACHB-671 TaxID=2692812 RepID=UPI0016839B81|nr:Cys-tRNA(Pro) deacylase [Leptolyngbya sp. FACHB-671]MBD2069297.1 Cys-tRNA(Pro) deacylase [Leptolyngbya sp. FACHB-671]
MKTNAVRILDNLGIAYELRSYEVDPEDLAAERAAEKIGLPPEQVFKTLVARGDRQGVCLAVISGSDQLDLKALAKLTGDRKVDTVALKEVQPLTGYIRGGVTALACKKDYPVYVDETVELFHQVAVSAGVRGTMILLAPADYLSAVKGTVGAIAKNKL